MQWRDSVIFFHLPSASVSQVISRLASLALAAALIISSWSPGKNHFCSAEEEEVVETESQAPLTPPAAASAAGDEITNNHIEQTGDDNGVDGMGFNSCLTFRSIIKRHFVFQRLAGASSAPSAAWGEPGRPGDSSAGVPRPPRPRSTHRRATPESAIRSITKFFLQKK